MQQTEQGRYRALRFVLLIGILSFFADCTYEGARGIIGPYLAMLHASGLVVGVVAGFGELAGYGLRLVSGKWADATQRYWPITIFGYAVQMASVPALALTGSWPAAAALIVLERVGKAIRNPPRDVILSHAGKQAGGFGWVFGLHEALDQFGAMFGPLLMAAVLAHHGSYHDAFAVLAVPALINFSLVLLARWAYPRPEDLETAPIQWPRITTRILGVSCRGHARRRRICRLPADCVPFQPGADSPSGLDSDSLLDCDGS